MFTSEVSLPGENSSLESVYHVFLSVRSAELFLTPYVNGAAAFRVPDGEEEGRLIQMDQAQLRCLPIHHVRGQEDDRGCSLRDESVCSQRHWHLSAQYELQALHAHWCVSIYH